MVFGFCKNILHETASSDKKIRRLRAVTDAAGGEFFILSEFTIESIYFSLVQSSNAPILQKSARFASSDPAPPSRFGSNCLIGFAKYAAVGWGKVAAAIAAAVTCSPCQQFSSGIMPASAAAIVSNSAALVGMRRGISVWLGFCISVAILTNSHSVKLSFCIR